MCIQKLTSFYKHFLLLQVESIETILWIDIYRGYSAALLSLSTNLPKQALEAIGKITLFQSQPFAKSNFKTMAINKYQTVWTTAVDTILQAQTTLLEQSSTVYLT